jgi:chromosome segregation ATPase
MSKLKSLADADKALISTLQAKIEDHKKELEHRAVTIAAIQRNFENLSSVAHADRQELSALREAEVRRRDESLAAAEELERLRAEVFELRKVREVVASTQDELAAAAKRHRRSLNNEAIVCLEAGLGHDPLAVKQQLGEIRALRDSLAQHSFDPVEIDAFKREGRP